MQFHLTPASHRVLERASRLRLQRGIAAISFVKLLSALFEEEECRAAEWLREAGLSLEPFLASFGIQTLRSPVSAPPFPMGTYGITPGQYTPPAPKSSDIEASKTDNNAPSVGNSYSVPLPSDESEDEHPRENEEQPQDILEQTEPPKYSIYTQQRGQKLPGQNRLQFYFDDQRITAWLFLPELEDCLEMVALRFIRQDTRHSISIAGGIKPIALGVPALTLLSEHLLLAAVLDTGDVGHWLRDNGFDAAELYERIDALTITNEIGGLTSPVQEEETVISRAADASPPVHLVTPYRLLDAAANRGREAIRVLEDYVRFLLDDAELTQRLKTFRHQFQNVLQLFPMEQRLAARNTEYDVGTDISAEGEYERPTADDILSANFSRLQESLRSLEEFSKMFDAQAAQQFEQLRYQCYTLHKDVAANHLAGTPADETVAFFTTAQSSVFRCGLSAARLYALVDVRSDESTFEKFVTDIIAGGVDIIQLRDKQADDRTILARSRVLKNCIAASERNVLFIMNDRPDLAVLAGADGVHVGQEELPVNMVRQIVGTMLIGVSTHSIEQARQAVLDGADYIGAGPVFESETKEFSEIAGLDYLRDVAAEMSIPAFAIGGITAERLDDVFQTGIQRIAVGSALSNAENPKEVIERLKNDRANDENTSNR